MPAYYNENDPKTAAWLRELIKAGLIADGEVDTRSITDVQPADLAGFEQCHFFAGIGGWSYALRLAGWPDDRAAWTGSCPCQPFSSAGKGAGADDSRHLWPAWFRLISECRPYVVFGEQVASADGLGWFDRVSTDLEGENYAVGAVDLCAASVGAFHIRQRLWFVADSEGQGRQRLSAERRSRVPDGSGSGEIGPLADATRRDFWRYGREPRGASDARGGEAWPSNGHAIGSAGGVGYANGSRLTDESHKRPDRACRAAAPGASARSAGQVRDTGGPAFWADADWLQCRDGKLRPVEPGTFPLAHGVSGRMVVRRAIDGAETTVQEEHWYSRIAAHRGFGNAIVPQVAAEVIAAYMELIESPLTADAVRLSSESPIADTRD